MKRYTKNIIIAGSILAIGIPSFFIIRNKIRANKRTSGTGTSGTGTSVTGTSRTGTIRTGTQQEKKYNPSSDVKAIAGWIYGGNIKVYPVQVNGLILPLSESNTRALAKAYEKSYGISLYDNLYGEWGNYYRESIDKLRNLNLT
tara:strand:- start:5 stop:436 length:432 start_codon:yes stop_codon:yes gene_type:complete